MSPNAGLFVLARSARWQAGAALAKGGFMLAFGLGVLGEAAHKVFYPIMPGVETMGIIGGVALAANLILISDDLQLAGPRVPKTSSETQHDLRDAVLSPPKTGALAPSNGPAELHR